MHTEKRIALIGAGGHALVVIDALRLLNVEVKFEIWDDNPEINGDLRLGIKVRSPLIAEALSEQIHIAIGNNVHRARMAEELLENGTKSFVTVIHPRAIAAESAIVGNGAFVAASAIIGPLASIGKCVIVNHGAVIDHDCQVEDWAHIAPNATLGGEVSVGEGTLIGAGAVVLPRCRIGRWVKIGAGAVVTHDVPDNVIAVGCPARWK